jgi:hypothetical protein
VNRSRLSLLAPLFAVLALLLGLAGSASAAFNAAATDPHYGNFSLHTEASARMPLEIADPDREIGVWLYDSTLGVPVYVMQNPWTKYDPEGLWGVGDSNGRFFDGLWNNVVTPAADFTFEGIAGYTEVTITGKDMGPSVSRAGNIGRNVGRAAGTVQGVYEIYDGVKKVAAAPTIAGGGTAVSGCLGTVPAVALGGTVAVAGIAEILHGVYSVGNGLKLGLKDYDASTSSARDQSEANAPQKTGPTEAYNRQKHYGKTPTEADRKAAGVGPDEVLDHEPSLVERYHNGDPSINEPPGWSLLPAERKASAGDRSRMNPQPRADSNAQGGKLKKFSMDKNKELGL